MVNKAFIWLLDKMAFHPLSQREDLNFSLVYIYKKA